MMYKYSLCFIVSCFSIQFSLAQNADIKFEQLGGTFPAPEQLSPFKAVWNSAVAHTDVDNDGDIDIVLAGNNINTEEIFTDLYINNGGGNYVLDTDMDFVGVKNGALAFGDVDGDGDMDLLLAGESVDGLSNLLYLNDGNGVFEDSGVSFPELLEPALGFISNGEVKNIIMAGLHDDTPSTYIYANDGDLNFSEVAHDLVHVEKAAIDIADADDDGYDDLILSGRLDDGFASTKVYIADDAQSFQEDADLYGIYDGDVSFIDLNESGKLDIVISGAHTESISKSRTYYHSTTLGYTTVTSGEPNQGSNHGYRHCSIAVGDINDDEDNDIMIMGYNDYEEKAFLGRYNNNGWGVTDGQLDTRFLYSEHGTIDYIDLDNDGDNDLFISGSGFARMYIKDGISYTPMMGTPLDGVKWGYSDFGDVDNDGDMDIIISGYIDILSNPDKYGGEDLKLYLNDGNANFTRENITILDLSGDIDMADFNGDDLADLTITNFIYDTPDTYLFASNGDGTFSNNASSVVPELTNSIVEYGDIDGDGDLDLFLFGTNADNNASNLFINDGSGAFSIHELEIEASNRHRLAVVDIDNDDDVDFIHLGNNEESGQYANVYFNDGNGNFEKTTPDNLGSPLFPILTYGDLNGDDYIDLIIAGNYSETVGTISLDSKVYLNDGTGLFNEATSIELTPLILGDAEIFDIDSDGDQDILMSGQTSDTEGGLTEQVYANDLYINDGSGNFSFEMSMDLELCKFVEINVADLDNDNDLDLWQVGADINDHAKASIWINNSCFPTSESITEEVCDSYVKPDGELLTETGIHEFTTLNASGCDSLITLDLTVKNSTAFTDVISSCDPYTWIDDNEYTESNNTATFTLANTAGCDSVVTLNLSINAFDGTIDKDGNELSTDSGADSYQWIDCDNGNSEITGATNSNYTATFDGSYAVVINNEGCTTTSDCIEVNIVGIAENHFADRIQLYPNPNHGDFTIDMGQEYQNVQCEILDIYGVSISVSKHQNKRSIKIPSKLPAGLYMVKLNANGKQAVISFVIT